MKSKDLLEELKKYPDDHIVIIQKDAEGNSFSPACDVDECNYIAQTEWFGDIYPLADKTHGNAVVIRPVN